MDIADSILATNIYFEKLNPISQINKNKFELMNYTEIEIQTIDVVLIDLLVAELSSIGFDGFEETEIGLKAFSSEDNYDKEAFKSIINKHQLQFTQIEIPQQNWNELWESNFSPITVEDFVGIRASFHETLINVAHEIIITPKMSFGTGHHATTYMMMLLMRDIDFNKKSVFDFGTGTGILAILAEKLGALDIEAVDYDNWCIENSIENIERNNSTHIKISKADNAVTNRKFDIVLANINKNIILANIESLTIDAAKGSQILLSGLLEEDEKDILEATNEKGWHYTKTIKKDKWIAIQFKMPI